MKHITEFNEIGHETIEAYTAALNSHLAKNKENNTSASTSSKGEQLPVAVRLNNVIPDSGRPKSIPRICIG